MKGGQRVLVTTNGRSYDDAATEHSVLLLIRIGSGGVRRQTNNKKASKIEVLDGLRCKSSPYKRAEAVHFERQFYSIFIQQSKA